MRELALWETGCLAGLLGLSLVLPLLFGARAPQAPAARRRCLRTVWAGQLLGALAGGIILISAPFAAGMGLVTCLGSAWWLLRQVQNMRSVQRG